MGMQWMTFELPANPLGTIQITELFAGLLYQLNQYFQWQAQV